MPVFLMNDNSRSSKDKSSIAYLDISKSIEQIGSVVE